MISLRIICARGVVVSDAIPLVASERRVQKDRKSLIPFAHNSRKVLMQLRSGGVGKVLYSLFYLALS